MDRAIIALVLFVTLIGVALVSFAFWLALKPVVKPPVITYDGEFDDGFLATKGWFTSDFTEKTDCNITSDILGWKEDGTCVYNSTLAFNATAEPSVNSRDWYISWVVDIDNPVEDMEVDAELKNTDTLQAADDVVIVDAKIYTHEDDPTEVFDLSPYIEDQSEIDASTGPLMGDEYVIWIHLRTKTISPDAAAGDDILILNLKLDTSEDVDEAYATFESS